MIFNQLKFFFPFKPSLYTFLRVSKVKNANINKCTFSSMLSNKKVYLFKSAPFISTYKTKPNLSARKRVHNIKAIIHSYRMVTKIIVFFDNLSCLYVIYTSIRFITNTEVCVRKSVYFHRIWAFVKVYRVSQMGYMQINWKKNSFLVFSNQFIFWGNKFLCCWSDNWYKLNIYILYLTFIHYHPVYSSLTLLHQHKAKNCSTFEMFLNNFLIPPQSRYHLCRDLC